MKINKHEYIDKLANLEGKKFGDILNKDNEVKATDKGKLGKLIEENYFGKTLDNKSEPDFLLIDMEQEEAMELKVTPVKKIKSGRYSAKERLVLNMIDYVKEINYDFYSSSFYTKCKHMSIVFYEYDSQKDILDFNIVKTSLHKFSMEDLEVIKRDWNIIIDKIKRGEAHNLSEADTEYLGATTKGGNLRSQPNSKIKAKSRAFSLKTKYMTYYFNSLNGITYEKLAKNNELKNRTINDIVIDKLKPFIGKDMQDLARNQGVSYNINNKSKVNTTIKKIINSLLEVQDYNKIEEFEKSNTQIRTLTLKNSSGKLKESSKICKLNVDEIVNEKFENSSLYEKIIKRTIYIVFNYNNGNYRLEKIKIYIPNSQTIEGFNKLWDETKKRILAGIELREVKQKNKCVTKNNLPGASEGYIGHIRPSAEKSYKKGDKSTEKYSSILPDGSRITNQAFWYNNKFLEKEVLNIDL